MSKHKPGPWKWIVNPKSKRVCLQSYGGKQDEVLTFARWGMNGAQPWFTRDGLFRNVMEFFAKVAGREHHAVWFGTIDHPDAQLIEAAPELLEALNDAFDWVCELLPAHATGGERLDNLRQVIAKAGGKSS